MIHQGREKKALFPLRSRKSKSTESRNDLLGVVSCAVSTALLPTVSPRHIGTDISLGVLLFSFFFPSNFLLDSFLFVIQPVGCLLCRQSYFISNFFTLLYFVKTYAKFLSSSTEKFSSNSYQTMKTRSSDFSILLQAVLEAVYRYLQKPTYLYLIRIHYQIAQNYVALCI